MIVVEANGLTKRYGNFLAIEGVSFEVAKGEIFGLLGPNGAGKTTTVAILTTLLLPDGGEARVAGFDVVKEANEVRRRIGVVTQKFILYDKLTALENLTFFARLYGMNVREAKERARELLELIGLRGWEDKLVGTFSTGMKQKLAIVRALIHDPEVIFLDEPTLGLDPFTSSFVRKLIRSLVKDGRTVILTTHYMNEAEQLCDRIAIMDNGRVVTVGSPYELKYKYGNGSLEEAFIKLTSPGRGGGVKARGLRRWRRVY